jgi:bla regulator protein BlaR1
MIDWLLGTFVATSGLIVLVLGVREPVRRRFGSRVAYGLWLIPAARLFMPTMTHTVERSVPAATGFSPLAQPVASESLWMARLAPPDPSLIDRLGGWPTVLLTAWLAVAAGLFLSRLIAFHRDRRAILAAGAPAGCAGSVRIVRTPEVVSPVALGILDPIIAVPADFELRYGERERTLVIAHELAHHRSGDLFANLFAFVLLCLQWFNPLAWVAHAAFRFDQEAACDARVLDKADAGDRPEYGRAIAKAASGRALLFASALDRRNSLHRRLQSMLGISDPRRRLAGRLIIVSAIAAALPLTASRAIAYVDVAAPAAAPVPSAAPVPAVAAAQSVRAAAAVPVVAAAQAAVAARPVRPAKPVVAHTGDLTINDDFVIINGKKKRWDELTPAEKDRVRAAVAQARADIADVRIDREQIMRGVSDAVSHIRIEEIQRDVANAQTSAADAIRDIDRNSGQLRRSGVNPEQLAANVRGSLQSVQNIDVEGIRRDLAAINPQQIAQTLSTAEQSVRKARADLDRIDARLRDQHR